MCVCVGGGSLLGAVGETGERKKAVLFLSFVLYCRWMTDGADRHCCVV